MASGFVPVLPRFGAGAVPARFSVVGFFAPSCCGGLIIRSKNMAKVQLGTIVTDISGKSGGNVFSKNRGGAYMRNKSIPNNPRSQRQQEVRASFGAFSADFRNLSATNITDWNTAAKTQYPYKDRLGNTRYLSGQQLYVKLNSNLKVINSTLLTAPLAPQGAGVSIDPQVNFSGNLSVTADSSPQTLTLNAQFFEGVPGGQIQMVVRATRQLSGGISNPAGMFRALGASFPPPGGAPVTLNLLPVYTDTFGGTLQSGTRIWFEVTPINSITGESGAPLVFSSTVQ